MPGLFTKQHYNDFAGFEKRNTNLKVLPGNQKKNCTLLTLKSCLENDFLGEIEF